MTNGTEREQLLAVLFGEDTQLVNLKFFRGFGNRITGDDVCHELRSAITQKQNGSAVRSTSFNDDAPQIDVRALLTT